MEATPKVHRERRRRRRLLAVLMAVAAVGSATSATLSLAVFTSQVAVGGNAFTTGTIILGVNPATAILSSAALMPGDNIPVGVPGAVVTVSNTGTAALRYAISGASTDTDNKHLNTQLVITVKQPDVVGGNSCAAFTGVQLFGAVVPTAGVNMVGNPAQGAQGGERTLAPGASETLCFKASLPIGTGNLYQNSASTYTFTFDAEQTANN